MSIEGGGKAPRCVGSVLKMMRLSRNRITGLVIAGFSAALVLSACGPQRAGGDGAASRDGADRAPVSFAFTDLGPVDETDAVAAEVGETRIYVSDVRREAVAQGVIEDVSALQPGDAGFQQVLSELVEQRLLALEARRQGLAQDPEARRRLAAAEERILGNILVETAVSRSVSDEAIRRIYEEQVRLTPPTEEVRARHILLGTREEAEEVVRLLSEGEDFATLAAQVSQDPATRFEGGDLGYFTREGILPGFAQVAFETRAGEVSEPFETEFGWHVLTVVDRRNQPRPSLEEMRPRIVRFLTMEGIQGLLDAIRETYPVTRSAAPVLAALRAEPGTRPEAIDLQGGADNGGEPD